MFVCWIFYANTVIEPSVVEFQSQTTQQQQPLHSIKGKKHAINICFANEYYGNRFKTLKSVTFKFKINKKSILILIVFNWQSFFGIETVIYSQCFSKSFNFNLSFRMTLFHVITSSTTMIITFIAGYSNLNFEYR